MRLIKNRKYIHDCDECVYIGTWYGIKDTYDLYYHQYDGYRTFIARYGNEGSEYTSASDSLAMNFLDELLNCKKISGPARAIVVAVLYNIGVI